MFISKRGIFEPTVMFFGLTHSPATFQSMMDTIFTKQIAEGWLKIFMDDLLIANTGDKLNIIRKALIVLKILLDNDLYVHQTRKMYIFHYQSRIFRFYHQGWENLYGSLQVERNIRLALTNKCYSNVKLHRLLQLLPSLYQSLL